MKSGKILKMSATCQLSLFFPNALEKIAPNSASSLGGILGSVRIVLTGGELGVIFNEHVGESGKGSQKRLSRWGFR